MKKLSAFLKKKQQQLKAAVFEATSCSHQQVEMRSPYPFIPLLVIYRMLFHLLQRHFIFKVYKPINPHKA